VEGRAEEVVLVATGRRERRRPPARCGCCRVFGVAASGTRADGRSRGAVAEPGICCWVCQTKIFFEANTYNGHNKSMNITKVRVLNMDN